MIALPIAHCYCSHDKATIQNIRSVHCSTLRARIYVTSIVKRSIARWTMTKLPALNQSQYEFLYFIIHARQPTHAYVCAGVPLILSCSPVCNAYKYCSSPGSNSNPMTFSIEAIYNNISWLRYLDKRQDWRRRPVAKWTMNMWIQSHIISVFI